jgi:Rod binding domain-containing protein
MAGALPSIDPALMPASVRSAGPEARKLYSVALSFEQLLTRQVAQALASTLHGPGDTGGDTGGSGGDASTRMVEQMLPTALAQGMTQAGGLGLAEQLYDSLGGAAAAGTATRAGA